MSSIEKLLNPLSNIVIFAVALLLPVAFTPLTSEFYDTAKFFILGLAVLILLLIWGIRLLTENKITIIKTPLDLLLLLFLVVAVLSTVLSATPYTALYGNLPKISGSLLFQIIAVLLYFMVVSNIKSGRQVATAANLMVLSGVIVAVSALLSYFKLFIPWVPAQNQNFTLAGSSAAAAIFLAILMPVVLSYLVRTAVFKSALSIFYFIALLLFALTIVLVGNMAAWIAALVAIALSLYQNKLGLSVLQLETGRRRLALKGSTGLLLGVAVISVIVAILSFTPTVKNATPLGKLAGSFQREIQLPFGVSWKISAGAFRDSPILGTGPATYLYDFTSYKSIDYNKTPFWNLRVSSAHDQYLQTWAELGGAGILLLLLIATTFGFFAIRNQDEIGLGMAGITFIVVMALYPTTVLTFGAGIFIMALFMAALRGRGDHELSIDLAGRNASQVRGTHILIPALIFLPLIVLILAGFYFLGRLGIGEFYHRRALNAVAQNKGLDTYNNLVQAEKANPQVDLYRVDLAQTNFALANAIAAQKGPSEASPGGSLSDQDKNNIKQLLQQAIAEGRAAVALAPRSANNWEILALIYRQISGVAQNALAFSLDSYGKAIQLDPLNPLLRLAVGGVYYQAKNYDLAIRFFDDAVSLKPDYSNAMYNLAVALRDKGSFTEGQSIAERLVAQLQDKPDSNDYKLATTLLTELKEKAPAPSSQPTVASPSAALENKNLPPVLNENDLGTQPQAATPAAVKK